MGQTVNDSTTTKLEGDCHLRFIEHCKKGGSIPEFCLEEEICRKTFDRWCEKYPHMMEAKLKGKTLAEGWWMREARNHLVTYSSKECSTKFDTNLYKFITGGRFGHTADKNLSDRMDELERKQELLNASTPKEAYAEIAEYETLPEEQKCEE